MPHEWILWFWREMLTRSGVRGQETTTNNGQRTPFYYSSRIWHTPRFLCRKSGNTYFRRPPRNHKSEKEKRSFAPVGRIISPALPTLRNPEPIWPPIFDFACRRQGNPGKLRKRM